MIQLKLRARRKSPKDKLFWCYGLTPSIVIPTLSATAHIYVRNVLLMTIVPITFRPLHFQPHSRKYGRKEEKTLLYKEPAKIMWMRDLYGTPKLVHVLFSFYIWKEIKKKWTTMDHFSSVFLTVFSPLDFGKKDN